MREVRFQNSPELGRVQGGGERRLENRHSKCSVKKGKEILGPTLWSGWGGFGYRGRKFLAMIWGLLRRKFPLLTRWAKKRWLSSRGKRVFLGLDDRRGSGLGFGGHYEYYILGN